MSSAKTTKAISRSNRSNSKLRKAPKSLAEAKEWHPAKVRARTLASMAPRPKAPTRKTTHTGVDLKSGMPHSIGRPTNRIHMYISFPYWFFNMLPTYSRVHTICGAAIIGAQTDGTRIELGQVSMKGKARSIRLSFLPHELEMLIEFGKAAKLAKYSSIVRTAVFVAFNIPGVEKGVISEPPTEMFSETLCKAMIVRGGTATWEELRTMQAYAPPIVVQELNQQPWLSRVFNHPDDKKCRQRFLSDDEVNDPELIVHRTIAGPHPAFGKAVCDAARLHLPIKGRKAA